MRTSKKIMSFLLAVVVLLTCAPLSGFVGLDLADFDIFSVTAQAASSGKCGENVKWKLDDEGTLTISGTGEMYNYNGVYSGSSASDADSVEWNNSRKKIKSIIIKSGITSIGTCAFELCPNLTSVTIPDSVTSIGEDAFTDCTGLKSVTIPDSVTNINSCAFRYCTNLTSIKIPDSVTSIGWWAFYETGYYNNSSNWKNGVLYIGKYLIKAKDSIKGSYKIKSGTKCIVDYAFWCCEKLTGITIPDSVTSIGTYAFEGCTGLKSIKIPNSVKYIGYGAFHYCAGLKIYGYEGSAAETYAKENGFKFVVHSHSYTSKVIKKATTSKSGTRKLTCSCGKSYTKTIAKISSVKLSKTSYTYNGKAQKPTVTVKDSNGNKLKKDTDYTVSYSKGRKNIGSYSVTVKFKGKYSGSKKLTFKIVPGQVKGLKQENKKGINFKWNAVKGAEGYQIYRYDSSKKKYVKLTSTTKPSCGNSKAKGSMKVKVRAYKVIGDRMYYGAFSSAVTFKAK